MKNVKVYKNDGMISIEIPVDYIMEKSKNEEWLYSYNIQPVKDDTDMIKYIIEKLKEKYNDVTDCEITRVDKLLIEILQEAYYNGEDFLEQDGEYE